MNFIKKQLAKLVLSTLGGNWLEKVLSKLPANGRKTQFSIILTLILTAIAIAGGDTPVWIIPLLEFLREAGASELANPAAVASTVSGAFSALFALHKLLKQLKASYEAAATQEAPKLNGLPPAKR